ncbi:NACHT domain-containing protein [Halanaerobacter jeridensis]|uniref:WD40 repeat protein n=1 Tax=Halanaerobacter jeridensis TaxID=706427 RepID=A0A938XVW2_9FIRM|nr:NACHT domain-containing protein [Halanaerobacter jeridensis]MBM7557794.1 WD40 repeat protein [Halanaerobacter jeridensis]
MSFRLIAKSDEDYHQIPISINEVETTEKENKVEITNHNLEESIKEELSDSFRSFLNKELYLKPLTVKIEFQLNKKISQLQGTVALFFALLSHLRKNKGKNYYNRFIKEDKELGFEEGWHDKSSEFQKLVEKIFKIAKNKEITVLANFDQNIDQKKIINILSELKFNNCFLQANYGLVDELINNPSFDYDLKQFDPLNISSLNKSKTIYYFSSLNQLVTGARYRIFLASKNKSSSTFITVILNRSGEVTVPDSKLNWLRNSGKKVKSVIDEKDLVKDDNWGFSLRISKDEKITGQSGTLAVCFEILRKCLTDNFLKEDVRKDIKEIIDSFPPGKTAVICNFIENKPANSVKVKQKLPEIRRLGLNQILVEDDLVVKVKQEVKSQFDWKVKVSPVTSLIGKLPQYEEFIYQLSSVNNLEGNCPIFIMQQGEISNQKSVVIKDLMVTPADDIDQKAKFRTYGQVDETSLGGLKGSAKTAVDILRKRLDLSYSFIIEVLDLQEKNFIGKITGRSAGFSFLGACLYEIFEDYNSKFIKEYNRTALLAGLNFHHQELEAVGADINLKVKKANKQGYTKIFMTKTDYEANLNPEYKNRTNIKVIGCTLDEFFTNHLQLAKVEEAKKQDEAKHLLEKIRVSTKDYYQKLKSKRFEHIDISEIILPESEQETSSEQDLDTKVELKAEEVDLIASIESLWAGEIKNAVILGSGGMGKTVSLLNLWKTYKRQKEKPVPFFIQLHDYNNYSKSKNFIMEQIKENYLNQTEITEDKLKKMMDKPIDDIPAVILLLDGFNEITVDEKMNLLSEIEKFNLYNGVQIVVTSRHDMQTFNCFDGYHQLNLINLKNEQIENYLNKQSVDLPEEERMLDLIRNPMMLTIYAKTYKQKQNSKIANKALDFKDKVNSAGELLWDFIEANLLEVYKSNKQKNEKLYHKLIIKHIVAYIGYYMEKKGVFSLNKRKLHEVIKSSCNKLSNPYFYDTDDNIEYEEVCVYLKKLNARKRKEILKIIVKELLLLVEEDGKYRFFHQIFRDYFSAVHIVNQIKIDLDNGKDKIEILEKRKFGKEVRKFIGELEKEYYIKPKLKGKQWSISHYNNYRTNLQRAIECYRGRFKSNIGYAVWNIIEIWKDVRGELTEADLSKLNLTDCNLRGVRCSRLDDSGYLTANFEGAKLNGNNFLSIGHKAGVLSVEYHPNGDKIISGSADGTIKEWNRKSEDCIITYNEHANWVLSVEYHPNGDKIISGSADGTIKEWKRKSEDCIITYNEHANWVLSVEYHPDGDKIISGSADGTIKEWKCGKKNSIRTYEEHEHSVTSVSYSPKGQKIVSGSEDGTIMEWKCGEKNSIRTYEGHKNKVVSLEYHPDGDKIISASENGTIMEWKCGKKNSIRTYEGHKNKVVSLEYHPEEDKIISGLADGTIMEWKYGKKNSIRTYEGHKKRVVMVAYHPVAYHPDGDKIMSGSTDGTIKEWGQNRKDYIRIYNKYSVDIIDVAYHIKNNKIALASGDNTIKEFSLEDNKCVRVYDDYDVSIEKIEYHPKEPKLVAGLKNGTIKEIDTITGKEIRNYKAHDSFITNVVYHPKNNKMLSTSEMGPYTDFKEWDIRRGELIKVYEVSIPNVSDVAYHPKEHKLVIAGVEMSGNNIIAELDSRSGEIIKTYEEFQEKVTSVIYHSEEDKIVSKGKGRDGEFYIRIWDVDEERCIKINEYKNKLTMMSHFKKINDFTCYPGIDIYFQFKNQISLITGWQNDTIFPIIHPNIINISGILLQGCDLSNLHPESAFTLEIQKQLESYRVEVNYNKFKNLFYTINHFNFSIFKKLSPLNLEFSDIIHGIILCVFLGSLSIVMKKLKESTVFTLLINGLTKVAWILFLSIFFISHMIYNIIIEILNDFDL